MAKYQLVASYYDMFEKNNDLKYKNEVVIDGKKLNIDLSTLQAIDAFTASHSRVDIFNILEQQLGITRRNHLAIKYQKNKLSKPIYYRIIENAPEFIYCTKDNQVIDYWALGEHKKTLGITTLVPTFLEERNILLTLLEEKNIEELKKRYPYEDSTLFRLIDQYINAPHDNDNDKYELENIIKKEFSRYKTFRGWMITKQKLTSYSPKKSKQSNNKKANDQPLNNKPITVHSIEEHEKDYEQQFNKKNGISYYSYQTNQYNTSRLDEDKEEFLEESEMSYIHNEESTYTKKRSRF